jgi:hypothetical protein
MQMRIRSRDPGIFLIRDKGWNKFKSGIRVKHPKALDFSLLVLCMSCVVGSAADIAKSALLYADQKLAALGVEARILLMIHDEIIWEVKDSTHITPLPY